MLQAVSNVAWPLVAYASVWRHVAGTGLEPLAQAVLGFALLPLAFVGLMQIVALSELDLSVRSLQLGLLIPLAVVALTLPWRPADAAWFAFEVGALYLSALMLAFAYVVLIRPSAIGLVRRWSWRQRGSYLLMALAQLVFLGPGLAAVVLFGLVLSVGPGGAAATAGEAGASVWALVSYGVALVALTRHELRWMGRAAAVAP